jgi:tRNA-Thr(GGU) m(6)t(6)A37 methyltransferase TsaA
MSSSSGPHLSTVFAITIALILDVSILLYVKKRYDDDARAAQEVYAINLQKEKDLRERERLGRISVQKKTRDRLNGENLKLGYQYRPIGFIESPFPDRRGTPRQPVLVPAALGKIRFDKSIIQFEHFKEIIQFSHIWVVFVFHENTNGDTDACQVPARIKPPRLGGQKVGCLSTRSPHRPNAIGLSVCEVVEIGSDFICVSGIDMVDGTPVLDIKPYIPYDSIHLQSEDGLSDSLPLPLPMSVAASSSLFKEKRLKVPSWIIDSDIPLHPVVFEDSALEALDDLILDRLLAHCSSSAQAIDLITQVSLCITVTLYTPKVKVDNKFISLSLT